MLVDHTRELHVGPGIERGVGAELRRAREKVRAIELIDEHHAMRIRQRHRIDAGFTATRQVHLVIQDVTRLARECNGAALEIRAAHHRTDHESAGRQLLLDPHRNGVLYQLDVEPVLLHQSQAVQPRTEYPQTITALFGFTAVRVVNAQLEGIVRNRPDQQAIRADAAMTIADALYTLGRDGERQIGRIDDQVVIAEAVTL